MTRNMGSADRIIRFLVGAVVLIAGLTGHHWWGWLGLIPIGTALIGWCPAYVPFKLSTCKPEAAKR